MVRTRSRPYGLCHHPYTKAHNKGFRSSYLHVYACLLLCFMLVLASLVLGFSMLDNLRGLDLVWLHPTPMRLCLDVTNWEASPDAMLLRTYPSLSTSWDAMLTMFVCDPLAFYASLHTCSHVHAWVLLASVLSMLQYNEDMDIRSKPTFVPHGHHIFFAFLLVCLLTSLLAFLFLCLPCLSCISALWHFHMLFASFPSIAYLLVSCLCLCMYIHGARTYGARAQSPRCKKKGQGCKHVDISQAVMFSRFRGLASPIWLCILLNPLPSSLLSLLDRLC